MWLRSDPYTELLMYSFCLCHYLQQFIHESKSQMTVLEQCPAPLEYKHTWINVEKSTVIFVTNAYISK